MTMEGSDPTRAGFTPPAAGKGRLSGNETEALCLKAARGAGMAWGLAEEAGFAARWLAARGLDGPGALLALLDGRGAVSPKMRLSDGQFRAEGGGTLCPIATGAALSDFAATGDHPMRAGPVDRPLLVVPFLHQIARAQNRPMQLDWPGGRVTIHPSGGITGDIAALEAAQAADVSVRSASAPQAAPKGSKRTAHAAPDTLARLDAYAMLTTVPASAASRADAGSAAGDND